MIINYIHPQPLCRRCHTGINTRDGYYSTPSGPFCLACGSHAHLVPDTVVVTMSPVDAAHEAANALDDEIEPEDPEDVTKKEDRP